MKAPILFLLLATATAHSAVVSTSDLATELSHLVLVAGPHKITAKELIALNAQLNAAKPKAVVYDYSLNHADAVLRSALVTSFHSVAFPFVVGKSEDFRNTSLDARTASLRVLASIASDGSVREVTIPPQLHSLPTLSFHLVSLLEKPTRVPAGVRLRLPEETDLKTLELDQVLQGRTQDLQNKIVLVGPLLGDQDIKPTASGNKIRGTYLHALAIAVLLHSLRTDSAPSTPLVLE